MQTWLAQKFSRYFAEEYNTEITIEGVDIKLFKTIVLEKLYIEDQHEDTLLYVEAFDLDIGEFQYSDNKLHINNLTLNNSTVKVKSDTAGVFNFQYLLDAFLSEEEDTTQTTPWDLKVHKIEIKNTNLQYYDALSDTLPDSIPHIGMNFGNLKFTKTNLTVSEINLDDTISCNIDDFNTYETSGFTLKKLASEIEYFDTGVNLQNTVIELKKSQLFSDYIKLSYDSLGDFSDFINKIKIDAKINPQTRIYTSDFEQLSPEIKGINLNFGLSAKAKGYANNIIVDSLLFDYSDNTVLKTNFKVKGLPDIYNSEFDVNIQKFSTAKADLDKIKLPGKGDTVASLPIPAQVGFLGLINYSGNLKGKISKFVNNGSLSTNLGNITNTATIGFDTITSKISFDVDVTGENLVVNKLIGDTTNYGVIDITAKLKGVNQGNSIKAEIETLVSDFIFNNYKYSELELLGRITEKSFNGQVTLIDPNVMLDINGDFYFTKDSGSYKFNGALQQAQLETLGLDTDTTREKGVLSLMFDGNLSGTSADDLTGTASLLNIDYTNEKDTFILEKMKLTALNDPEQHLHKLKLNSRLIDFSTDGDYELANLTYSLQAFLSKYLPSVITPPEKTEKEIFDDSEITFDINIKETSDLFKIFVPGLHIGEGTNFKGSYNSANDNFMLNGYSPFIAYDVQKLSEIIFNSNSNDNDLTTSISAERLYLTQENSLDYFVLTGVIKNDSIELDMRWDNQDSVLYKGNISTISKISSKPNSESTIIETFIKPSSIVFADSLWNISKSKVTVDSSLIHIDKLNIFNDNQKLKIDGAISDNNKDSLILNFNQFQLNNLDLLTGESGLFFSGELNGDIKVANVYSSPFVFAEANIDSFVVNNEFIGDVEMKGNTHEDKIFVDITAQRLELKTLEMKGNYNTTTDSLDFFVNLNKFRLRSLRPYVQDFISGLNGRLNTDLHISGTTEKPELTGNMKFHKCVFTLDYTKTQYNFSDKIIISEDKFAFDNMEIFSGRRSKAFLNGEITHNYFSDIVFDLTVDAKNFLFLNTKAGDNDLFYGTAYASGLIGISGPMEKMVVDVNVVPRPQTHLYLPLSSASEVSENDFITFINVNDTTEVEKEETKPTDINGIQMNVAIEMTPDAIIEMIFDETVGDKMTAQGSGPIRMEINTLGDFKMYGEYNISKGSYLFTLQNLINKYFEVKPGSTLKWNGSPYDALLDLTAVYKVKSVPLYDLVLDEDFKDTKIPVDCNLSMQGNLSAPTIAFDIDLKNADDKIESQVNNLTEDDLNKQVLSLLIINKFQPLPGLSSDFISAGGVGVNTTELLSNQLSNWLSQISNDFDIGFSYRPGSDISSQEVEVALSTQLWNDRISINGNVGVEGQASGSAQSGSSVVGDFDIEVKITKNGKFRVRAFTRANNNTVYEMAPYTHGVGIFYREDFNTVSELLNRYSSAIFNKNDKDKDKDKQEEKNNKNNKEAVKEENDKE